MGVQLTEAESKSNRNSFKTISPPLAFAQNCRIGQLPLLLLQQKSYAFFNLGSIQKLNFSLCVEKYVFLWYSNEGNDCKVERCYAEGQENFHYSLSRYLTFQPSYSISWLFSWQPFKCITFSSNLLSLVKNSRSSMIQKKRESSST